MSVTGLDLDQMRSIARRRANTLGYQQLVGTLLGLQGITQSLLAQAVNVRDEVIDGWLANGEPPTIDQGARLRLFAFTVMSAHQQGLSGDELLPWLLAKHQKLGWGTVVSLTSGDNIGSTEVRLNDLLDELMHEPAQLEPAQA